MSKTLGFAPKQRTKEEINQEYNQHAVMYGHEACMVAEATEMADKIIENQQERLKKMVALRVEASKLTTQETKTESPLQFEPEGPTVA